MSLAYSGEVNPCAPGALVVGSAPGAGGAGEEQDRYQHRVGEDQDPPERGAERCAHSRGGVRRARWARGR